MTIKQYREKMPTLRTPRYSLFIVILVLGMLFHQPVQQAKAGHIEALGTRGTIIVNASGSGDHTHIQWAIDNASEGDTIIVEAGTYRENLIINKTVSLVGAGRDNTTIDGQGNGDVIHVEASWVNISGFQILNAPYVCSGILLDGVDSCIVTDNRLCDNGDGICLDDSDWNGITENICRANDIYGIILYDSFNNTLQNNTCGENIYGIFLSRSSNNILKENLCLSNRYDGIALSASHNNEITNNNCSYNRKSGIDIHSSDHNSLLSNYLAGNDRYGIGLECSFNSVLSGNRMVGGGIYFYGNLPKYWNSHDIEGSNLVNGRPVIYVKDDTNGVISANAAQIILAGCENICVKDQNISGVITGIQVGFSRDITIEDNNLSDNSEHGIYLYNSSGVRIRRNTCDSNGGSGIRIYHFSSDNEVIDNSCIGNYYHGMVVGYDSNDNSMINNIFCSSNEYGIYVFYGVGNTISGNTANDNYLGIKIDYAEGTTLRDNQCSSNYLYGISLTAQYCSLDNNTCLGSRAGIHISYGGNNVSNNTCTGNQQGIHFSWHSTGNSVSNNRCSSNTENGLLIDDNSNGNVLSNNTFGSNAENGLLIDGNSNGNILERNILLENRCGIAIDYNSDENSLSNNSLIRNTKYGVDVSGNSQNNLIVDNIFLDNNDGGIQASDDCWGTRWDSVGSGNYWSDRTGPDTDFDGIVDGVYAIDGSIGAMDHFPLVNPYGVLLPVAETGQDIFINQHEKVTFDSSACLNRAHIVGYAWNFAYDGERYTISGPAPSFTFHTSGTYVVTLTVENMLGEGTSDNLTVCVKDITPPVAEAGENVVIDQYETVYFDSIGSTDNTGIVNYSWTFIYDHLFNVLYGESPEFTFHLTGIYNVVLRVADVEGNKDPNEMNVTVLDTTPPEAYAGGDITTRQYRSIRLYGDRSKDNVGIVNHTWTIPFNGTYVTLFGESIVLLFPVPGQYNITLTVSDAMGNRDTDVVKVIVEDWNPPHAECGDNVDIDPGGTVVFDGRESSDNTGIVKYNWEFEYDGETIHLTGPRPFFTFDSIGRYIVTLLVTDERGNEDMDWLAVTVKEPKETSNRNYNKDHYWPSPPDEETEERERQSYLWSVTVVLCLLALLTLIFLLVLRSGRERRERERSDGTGRVDMEVIPKEVVVLEERETGEG